MNPQRQEIMDQMWEQIGGHRIAYELRFKTDVQIRDRVEEQVEGQVYGHARDQIIDEVDTP